MRVKLLLAGICMMLCGMLVPSFDTAAQETEVKTIHISDAELQNIIEEEISNLVATRATQYNITWTVPADTRYTTGAFSMTKDKKIYVSVTLSKSGWAGILDSKGTLYYVSGKSIAYPFMTPSDGSYRVFVQNNSSSGSLTAKGYYQK